MTLRSFVLLALCLLCYASLPAATVPVGTELEVRLTSEATSGKPSGTAITGVVIAPVFVNGTQVISTGTRLTGNTADVNAGQLADGQTVEKPATLRIQFTKIEDAAYHSQPISCVLAGVDNAREAVDDSGLITGISASESYEARIDQGLNKLAEKYQGFAQILTSVKGSMLQKVDASIDYKPGVEVALKVTRAFDWSAPPTSSGVGPISPEADLARLANAEPSRTVALSPPKPSDLTNLMFIGSKDKIEDAFKKAGWFTADELSRNSKMKTAQAIIEDRGYTEAPVSVLNLDGKPPDLTFQKTNNTFERRHHIRVWQRPDRFDGKPVWAAAATHDTGFVFSKESKNFTHGIDSHIDIERSKVTNDMVFTGEVKGIALVNRASVGPDLSNATGDKLITDGKIAVLEF
ncbi:MAG: LssY C-terminal domain-containing protein [Acidobacteriota bacterium]|nr:LssY C-terminal domain-containing protein [Acidobacteriota bacterium]